LQHGLQARAQEHPPHKRLEREAEIFFRRSVLECGGELLPPLDQRRAISGDGVPCL
jgi:hypothetical protein